MCEDNGFLSDDGKPTLVVLVVTHDNGNKTRIPYEAGKTIANLYEDARRLACNPSAFLKINEQINKIEDIVTGRIPLVDLIPTDTNSQIKDRPSGHDDLSIAREDQVKCIRQEKDIDGNVNEEIEVGKIYRVIDIIKKNKRVSYYEVLNDEKNDKIRIAVFPSEIELFKKFVRTTPPRKMTFEMIERCDCGTQVAVLLNGDFYEGVCEVCNNTLKVRRPVKDDKPTN